MKKIHAWLFVFACAAILVALLFAFGGPRLAVRAWPVALAAVVLAAVFVRLWRGAGPPAALALAVALQPACSFYEYVDAGEIVIVQDLGDGDLHVYSEPGWASQWFGHVEIYPRSAQYWFSSRADQGGSKDESMRVRFNDGGHANLSGSLRIDMPLDPAKMLDVHKTYRSSEAVMYELVRPAVERSVYMTGPLMSSKESYADRRNELITFIEDQLTSGVYATEPSEVKTVDVVTGAEKTVTVVRVLRDAAGQPLRQEGSPMQRFGIRAYNLSINQIAYEERVEKQIVEQQRAIMEVQTAMAGAKKAEQLAITVAKEGEAAAAKSKWEQEVIKAKLVTEAQQKLEVAELDRKTAEQRKQESILLGQGEAERKKLVMAADGALAQKLETWLEAQRMWALAVQNYGGSWTPNVVMGDGSSGGVGGAQALVDLLTAKTARDLGLDLQVQRSMASAKK